MSRHRVPVAATHRDSEIIAPVIARDTETECPGGQAPPGLDAAAGPASDGPTPARAEATGGVPSPRRSPEGDAAGRHAAATRDGLEVAGRHRAAAQDAACGDETDLPARRRHRRSAEPGAADTAGRGIAAGSTTWPDAADDTVPNPHPDVPEGRRHRRSSGTLEIALGESAGDPPTRPATTPVPPGRAARRPARRHDRTGSRPPARRHAAGRARGQRRRSALVLVTVAAGLLALPTVSSASVDQCRWQRAAHALLLALNGADDSRSKELRDALTQAGIGPQLPAECAPRPAQASAASPAATGPSATSAASRPTSTKPAPPTTTTKAAPKPSAQAAPKPARAAPAAPAGSGAGSTAAAAFGWGAPVKSDDFTAGLGDWGVYNGAGHGGNGRRTPDAAKVANGILTITGDGNGNSAGMAWGDGQKYGRWEARVRSTAGDDSYHPVLLLWPDAENWPVGGEVDWMEISSADRQDTDTFLHYGASNNQVHGNVDVDATQWHNWAVEWTPQGVTTFLDGKPWWSTKNSSILPPGPMHMTIQLDYFGGGNPKTSQMMVDWVHQYKV